MWNNQQGIAPMNKPPINNKSLTNIRNYKTQECKFFKLGQCTRDKDCTYLHDGEAPGEQEPTPELLFKLQVMNAQKQQRQREFFHRQNGMIPSPVQVPQARYDHNGMPLSIQTEMLSPGLPLSTMPYAARVMYSATPGPMNGKMTPPTFWGPNPIVSIPGPGTPTQGMQPSMYPPTPFGYLRQHNPSRRAGAPCVFFKQGKCTKGDLCMYAHIMPTEEESKSDSSNSTEAVDTNTSEEANQSEASKPEAAK
jgi:hypothetical protein